MDIVAFLLLSMISTTVFHAAGLGTLCSILLGVGVVVIYVLATKVKDKKKKDPASIVSGPMSKREEEGWDEWFEMTDTEKQAEAKEYAQKHELDESVVLDKLEKTGSYK